MQSPPQRQRSSLSHAASTSSTVSQASTLRPSSPAPRAQDASLPSSPLIAQLREDVPATRYGFARAYSDDQLRLSRAQHLPPDPHLALEPSQVSPSLEVNQRHSFAGDTPFPVQPLPVLDSFPHAHHHLPSTLVDGMALNAFPVDSELAPPSYHTHHFPPTPPPLDLTGSHESPFVSAFSQHLTQPAEPLQPPSTDLLPPPPSATFGNRFPRWRGWLEKRALERHYARMDAAATGAPSAVDSNGNALPGRKKSWGAWINDPDALSDEEDGEHRKDGHPSEEDVDDPSALPPLHVHHYGSRFLPHVPSQPLCSLLVELPPAPTTSTRRLANPRQRQILLLGTSEGLFAFQRYGRRVSAEEQLPDKWNQDVQCIPIWSGLGVYQMCVLVSKEPPTSSSPFTSPRPDRHTSGIFLALTCPSTASHGLAASTLMQLSAHAGTILESVAPSGSTSSSTSSSGHAGLFADPSDSIPAANFGPAAGGGSGRAVPPAASGTVRMWNLEAIRKILLYALDHPDPHLPLDLLGERTASKEPKNKLAAIFKKTFHHNRKSKPAAAAQRRAASGGLEGTVDPLSMADEAASPVDHFTSAEDTLSSSMSTENLSSSRRSSFQSSSHHNSRRSFESLPPSRAEDLPSQDSALSSVMGLALSSVPIRVPSQTTGNASQSNPSLSSLFADDLYQSFSGKQSHGKAKDRDAASAGSSKGVLFFSVHEAAPDTKGSGTWYLALATARTVRVYEAALPKRGSARSWSWVKEFYAPFPVKAIAFAPASVSDDAHTPANLASLPSVSGSTRLRVSSVDAPLSPSRRSQPSSPNTSKSNTGSVLRPHHSMGKAAPTSWLRADLCVFLSFGRRAVVVRLSDSNVREFELQPLSDVALTTAMSGANMPSHLSLQPSLLAAEGAASDRSRPQSVTGLSTYSSSSSNVSHSRNASLEQRLKEHSLERKSRKHNWIGFTSIQAHIRIRQHEEAGSDAAAPPPPAKTPIGSHPRGQSLLRRSPSSASTATNAAQLDKDLPRTPAPQNASFVRRVSRLDMDPDSLRAYKTVQAEDSSDSEEDEDAPSSSLRSAAPLRKYALMDRGPLPQSRGSARFSRIRSKAQVPTGLLDNTNLVSVKLALVSRGSVTHVLPLPLPADLARPSPLGALQWSDTPNSVSGWARVLGVERARSTGATTLGGSSNSNSSGTSTPTTPIQLSPSAPQPARLQPVSSGVRKNRLGLHVSVTCVAFLASRIELKQVSFQVPVAVDFPISRHSELELVPLVPLAAYEASRAVPRSSHTNRHPDGNSNAAQPRPEKLDLDPDLHAQELEYLCGSLQALHPVDLDPTSSGAQSLILPLTLDTTMTSSNTPATTTSSSSTATTAAAAAAAAAADRSSLPLFPELAGDAGIIAFDWRGANDFRIFSVGAHG